MKNSRVRLQFSISKETLSKGYFGVKQAQLEAMKMMYKEVEESGTKTKVKNKEESEQLKLKANRALISKVDIFEGTTENSLDRVRRLARGLTRDKLFRKTILMTYKDILKVDSDSTIEPPYHFDNIGEARAYLIIKLAARDTKEKNDALEINLTNDIIQKYNEEIDKAVDFARSWQFLTSDWNDFVLVYLANPDAELDDKFIDEFMGSRFINLQLAEVLDIDNLSTTVKFSRGMTKKDFMKMWDALGPILQSGLSHGEVDWLKTRLAVLRYQEKMSYQEIAKIYYPEYFEGRNRSRDAIDLVRRALERMKEIAIDVD